MLARLTLVFGYNFLLALLLSALLAVRASATSQLQALILQWLGPMLLLSAISLALSLRFGSIVGVSVALMFWVIRLVVLVNAPPAGALIAQTLAVFGSTNAVTPAGVLRWTQPEAYDRLIVLYQELVFGQNGADQQMYFLANDHLKGLRLDSNPVFTQATNGNQPVTGPDGTAYATFTYATFFALAAYTPAGSFKWSFSGVVNNTATAPDVGPDGVVYFAHNLSTLYAINPDGTQRWSVVTTEIMNDPIVDQLNPMVAMGGIPTYGMSGFFKAVSTASHSELWRVTLAPENGGNLVPDSRPRFTPDGKTLFITAEIPGGDQNNQYGYVYPIDATGAPVVCTTNCLRSTDMTLTAKLRTGTVTANGRVTVKNEGELAIQGATVPATWTLPGGATQALVATTNASGVATLKTSGGQGTYTLTVTNIAKTGYTFDAANSILTKSITR